MIALTELEEALQAASILRDEVKRQAVEIGRLQAALYEQNGAIAIIRSSLIEECAMIAEAYFGGMSVAGVFYGPKVAVAIRALKDKS